MANASWNVDADGAWNLGSNWSPAASPGSTTLTNTDVATFGLAITAARTVTVDTTRYIGSLSFTAVTSFAYTLSSGTLYLNSGGISVTAGTASHVIASTIRLLASTSFTASASLFTFSGPISPNVSGTTTLTLTGIVNGSISGALTDGAGVLRIVKSSSGAWILSGVNTFSGGFSMSAGTVRVGSNEALGGATNALTLSGGTLQSSGTTPFTITAAGTSSIASGMIFGATSTYTGPLTFNNPFTLGGVTVSITVNSAVTFNGPVSSGSLSKSGSAVLTLNGANTLTVLTASAGVIVTGILTSLSGIPTATVVSGAALAPSASDGNGNYGSTDLLISGAGPSFGPALALGYNLSLIFTQIFRTITLTGTSSSIGPTGSSAATLGTPGAVVVPAGHTLSLYGGNSANVSYLALGDAGNNFNLSGPGTVSYGGTQNAATQAGSIRIASTADSSVTATPVIRSGNVFAANLAPATFASSIGAGSAVILGDASISNVPGLYYTGLSDVAFNRDITLIRSTGGILGNASFATLAYSGVITAGTAGTPFIVDGFGPVIVDSVLGSNLAFEKRGYGSVQLNNPTNTYAGTTTVSGGRVVISDMTQLGTNVITINVNTAFNAGFRFTGYGMNVSGRIFSIPASAGAVGFTGFGTAEGTFQFTAPGITFASQVGIAANATAFFFAQSDVTVTGAIVGAAVSATVIFASVPGTTTTVTGDIQLANIQAVVFPYSPDSTTIIKSATTANEFRVRGGTLRIDLVPGAIATGKNIGSVTGFSTTPNPPLAHTDGYGTVLLTTEGASGPVGFAFATLSAVAMELTLRARVGSTNYPLNVVFTNTSPSSTGTTFFDIGPNTTVQFTSTFRANTGLNGLHPSGLISSTGYGRVVPAYVDFSGFISEPIYSVTPGWVAVSDDDALTPTTPIQNFLITTSTGFVTLTQREVSVASITLSSGSFGIYGATSVNVLRTSRIIDNNPGGFGPTSISVTRLSSPGFNSVLGIYTTNTDGLAIQGSVDARFLMISGPGQVSFTSPGPFNANSIYIATGYTQFDSIIDTYPNFLVGGTNANVAFMGPVTTTSMVANTATNNVYINAEFHTLGGYGWAGYISGPGRLRLSGQQPTSGFTIAATLSTPVVAVDRGIHTVNRLYGGQVSYLQELWLRGASAFGISSGTTAATPFGANPYINTLYVTGGYGRLTLGHASNADGLAGSLRLTVDSIVLSSGAVLDLLGLWPGRTVSLTISSYSGSASYGFMPVNVLANGYPAFYRQAGARLGGAPEIALVDTVDIPRYGVDSNTASISGTVATLTGSVNYNVSGTTTLTSSAAARTMRVGSTLTLNSGVVLAVDTLLLPSAVTTSGGNIRPLSTQYLFVYFGSAGAVLSTPAVDNGGTPTVLCLTGLVGTTPYSALNTHTGGTILATALTVSTAAIFGTGPIYGRGGMISLATSTNVSITNTVILDTEGGLVVSTPTNSFGVTFTGPVTGPNDFVHTSAATSGTVLTFAGAVTATGTFHTFGSGGATVVISAPSFNFSTVNLTQSRNFIFSHPALGLISATFVGAGTATLTLSVQSLTLTAPFRANGLTKSGAYTLTLTQPGGQATTLVSSGKLRCENEYAAGIGSLTLSVSSATIETGNTGGQAGRLVIPGNFTNTAGGIIAIAI